MHEPGQPAFVEGPGQRRIRRGPPGREPSDIEQPQLRRPVAHDDPRHRVAGGRHDGDAMDVRKQAQRGGFVCDAVLQAENRLLPHARRAQGLQRFDGVLRLHRQADQVVMAKRDLAGMRDDRHGRDHVATGMAQGHRPAFQRLQHPAPGDADDLSPGIGQRGGDRAADRADAVDDPHHPHQYR
jgi:hypothetical protein